MWFDVRSSAGLAAAWVMVSSSVAAASETADPGAFSTDVNCASMATTHEYSAPHTGGEEPYFDRAVPRHIHQIWFGVPNPEFEERMQAWRGFAALFGYSYKLWGENDDDLIASLMPPANRQVFDYYRQRSNWRAASDVLRLSLLDVLGGIYLDSDLQPPSDAAGPFDFSDWLPMRNIVALLESEARQTGPAALFASNMLLMAPAKHPLIAHMVATLPHNHDVWAQRLHPTTEYTTGPFFLNLSLGGPITLLQVREIVRYHLGGGGPPLGPEVWKRPRAHVSVHP